MPEEEVEYVNPFDENLSIEEFEPSLWDWIKFYYDKFEMEFWIVILFIAIIVFMIWITNLMSRGIGA